MSSLIVEPPAASGLSRDAPFPGLRPYEENDSPWFFGRGRETNDLLKRLRRVRFLAVVGPSGCGKSSVVKAGLLPAIRDGYLDSAWRVVAFRPGDRPLDNLAEAISFGDTSASPASLRGRLDSGPMGLVSAIQSRNLAADTHVLIVVDQFEELFQFVQRKGSQAQEETKAFLKVLLAAAASDTIPIYVVITMRIEWLNESASYVGLAEAINEGIYLIPQMTRRQFQQAILGPIEAAGGSLTTALLDRMLNDLDGRTDQLPILQHALMRMWERRKPAAPLDIPVYTEVGEFSRCLELHANEIYGNEFDAEGKCAVEALFRSITQMFKSRKVRRPRPLGEIADFTKLPIARLIAVVEAFRRTGRSFLVTTPGELRRESIVDISHEALMRQWTQLREWVESEADLQSKIDRLEGIAAEWVDGERKNGSLLYRGSVLKTAERWKPRLKPDGPAAAFLLSSRRAEFWRNVQWKGSLGLGVVLILAALGGWALSEIESQKQSARLQAQLIEARFTRQRNQEKQLDDYVKSVVATEVKNGCSAGTAAKIQNSVVNIESKRVYLQYAGSQEAALAKGLQYALAQRNYAVPGIENVGSKGPSQTEVRYWHPEDRTGAISLAGVLGQLMAGPVIPKHIENQRNLVPAGQFEVWLAAPKSGAGATTLIGDTGSQKTSDPPAPDTTPVQNPEPRDIQPSPTPQEDQRGKKPGADPYRQSQGQEQLHQPENAPQQQQRQQPIEQQQQKQQMPR